MSQKSVLVTGGTGFIGSELVRALSASGAAVTVLVRSPTAVFGEGVRVVPWGELSSAVAGQDALVNLAGEQAVGVRWTDGAKQRISSSRVDTTQQLVAAMAAARPRPGVLVNASAVGYYGACPGDQAVDESSGPGSDFLAEVCQAWEAAALAAGELGVRVVLARLGVVFDRGGGALEEMAKPFRMFAGGPIGTGEQVVSWVHRADAVGILRRCIEDDSLSGPVNVVAPEAVPQAELARAIGRVLGRPAWLRAPAFALRARFGEGADPLLTGQRVVPAKLRAAGYVWQHPDLEAALRAALG
ncbi:MAG: TIGR01777 family oxidoreductase [Polyangiaceae bacterium]|nr:TIGR01777 family oxidoreductase [Polyangiaceae bacterium]